MKAFCCIGGLRSGLLFSNFFPADEYITSGDVSQKGTLLILMKQLGSNWQKRETRLDQKRERVILNSCKAIYEKQMDAYYSVTWRKK